MCEPVSVCPEVSRIEEAQPLPLPTDNWQPTLTTSSDNFLKLLLRKIDKRICYRAIRRLMFMRNLLKC